MPIGYISRHPEIRAEFLLILDTALHKNSHLPKPENSENLPKQERALAAIHP